MPYDLRKSGNQYYVVDGDGKHKNEKPMPKWRAVKYMRALYAAENASKKKGFSVFKQADGTYRWFTISSSAFRDRDGEIITAKALEDDVDRCDETKEYGPLRWWHLGGWEAPDGVEKWETWKATAGVDIGMCDFNMLWGKMLLESGTFKTPELGEAFSQAKEKLEVSIAFAHPQDEPGKAKQFDNIHRFERSLLPEGLASNLLTKLNVLKGDPIMKTTEKLAALVAILKGKPELAKQILADAEGVQKAAEEAGLSTKEVSEMISGDVLEPVEEVVISPPVVEAVAETPPVETAPVDTKAAPVVPPEPVEIGDWTPEQLTAFIVEVMKQGMASDAKKKEVEAETLNHTMKQASEAITALAEQVTKLTQGLEEQKAVTAELTDSRPVGLKQMQSKRATERGDNVVSVAPTGPQIDPGFLKFSHGGK